VARALQVEGLVGARALQVEEFATARALQAGIAQLLLGMVPGTIHIHLTHNKGEKLRWKTKYFGAMRTTYGWELGRMS